MISSSKTLRPLTVLTVFHLSLIVLLLLLTPSEVTWIRCFFSPFFQRLFLPVYCCVCGSHGSEPIMDVSTILCVPSTPDTDVSHKPAAWCFVSESVPFTLAFHYFLCFSVFFIPSCESLSLPFFSSFPHSFPFSFSPFFLYLIAFSLSKCQPLWIYFSILARKTAYREVSTILRLRCLQQSLHDIVICSTSCCKPVFLKWWVTVMHT